MVLSSRFALLVLGLLSLFTSAVLGFDNSRFDNLAVYWGQNSYGATHPSDTANFQRRVGFYCSDNTIDVIPIAFLTTFFGAGGLPELNLANICSNSDNATFPGSWLANCAALASDITTCQAKGKILTLSLGGANGGVGFSSDSQATNFADQIWNLFLGGSSVTRPFGSAVLDGVDLDIEAGGSAGYPAFVNRLRSHFSGASKKYYITAAPQCPFPDASLGGVLNAASFDAVYVQFYNNPCGLQNFGVASEWDFGLWDNWARTISPNPKVKVYIGAPASPTAAGGGYQSAGTLSNIAKQMRNSFPSFGGVMMWDESQAYQNGRYDVAIKNGLVAAGGTGFTFPPCSAPAFVSGNNYPGGSKVSFNGYIWQAKWFASSTPANDPSNDWSAISACGGQGTPTSSSSSSTISTSSTRSTTSSKTSTTTSTKTSTTSSKTSSSTSSSHTPAPTGVSCAGVPAWDSTTAYVGGSQVTSGGHLWTAKWWSEADVPGGPAGDWTDDGPCAPAAAALLTQSAGRSDAGITPAITGIPDHAATSASPTNSVISTKHHQNATDPRRRRSSRVFKV